VNLDLVAVLFLLFEMCIDDRDRLFSKLDYVGVRTVHVYTA
jgi:hypothetical protein